MNRSGGMHTAWPTYDAAALRMPATAVSHTPGRCLGSFVTMLPSQATQSVHTLCTLPHLGVPFRSWGAAGMVVRHGAFTPSYAPAHAHTWCSFRNMERDWHGREAWRVHTSRAPAHAHTLGFLFKQ
eukprot:351760-Chlamydomonas_euryale.AAC.5